MVKSARIRALEHGLVTFIKPALANYNFTYYASTRAFYRKSGECTQIIQFQPDVRGAEGTFTVYLAIYHPVYHDPNATNSDHPREFDCLMGYRQRLGPLRESSRTRLFKYFLSDTEHWLSWWLTTMPDKWWPFSDDETLIMQSLKNVLSLLETYGLPWFEANTNIEAMKTSYSTILMRSEKNRKPCNE